jgi:hypothetical protein
VTEARRTHRVGSRRGPSRADIVTSILGGYSPSEGCPPLQTLWGGYDLAENPWLRRFAETIADCESYTDAWNKLTGKCDASYIIELLYLFTCKKKTRVDEDRDAYHLLNQQLDKILPKYNELLDEIGSLVEKEELSNPMVYCRPKFILQLQLLQWQKRHLEAIRDSGDILGSRKRKYRNWYLLLLGTHAKAKTGSFQISQLANLIEAALAAHSQTNDGKITYEAGVRRGIQRWKKLMNCEIFGGSTHFLLAGGDASASTDENIPF